MIRIIVDGESIDTKLERNTNASRTSQVETPNNPKIYNES